MCGKCCSYEIPVTILDVERLSNYLNISPGEIFTTSLEKDISIKAGLYKLKKDHTGTCIFQKDNKCTVHSAKPTICQLYICESSKDDYYEDGIIKKDKQWEESIAKLVSKIYIEKNGFNWDQTDFFKAIETIRNNIKNKHDDKLRIASNEQDQPICMIYNCNECDKKGEMAKETLVTIFDVVRISEKTKQPVKKVFEKYLDKQLSKAGTFKTKRKNHCIFFTESKCCKLDSSRPKHCEFTPCQLECDKLGNFDAFYVGEGTLLDQYKHHIAINLTQQYTSREGTKYNDKLFDKYLFTLNNLIEYKIGFKEFCEKVIQFRYDKSEIEHC